MSAGADTSHLSLGAGNEFDAIRTMLRVWGPRAEGIGDDAAVLVVPEGERLVASTDASFEEVHFRRAWLAPREIGARAAAAALSDLAAMAATPLGMLLALGVPLRWRAELEEIAAGVGEMASHAGCPIVGGNVSDAAELSLTITVLGTAREPLTRAGVRPGDTLWVTGSLGGARGALAALLDGRTPDAAHRTRFAAPQPRLAEARWLAAQGAHAAIDVSDGLARDAAHLAAASAVQLTVELSALPLAEGVRAETAARSGEEYELLVAFAESREPDADEFRARFGIPLTRVGRASPGEGVRVESRGVRVDLPTGHDHFS